MPDGDAIIIGWANTASNPGAETRLTRNRAVPNTVFIARNQNAGNGILGQGNGASGLPPANPYGVWGDAGGNGDGLYGASPNGRGVIGRSTTNIGVWGESTDQAGVYGSSTNYRAVEGLSAYNYGVHGESNRLAGVRGVSATESGVEGFSYRTYGVLGESGIGGWAGVHGRGFYDGVYGASDNARGVVGKSTNHNGVFGICTDNASASGVYGQNDAENDAGGFGVSGRSSEGGTGVYGESTFGVLGVSPDAIAVIGTSTDGIGVWGQSTNRSGVFGASTNGLAGDFDGDVRVTGKLIANKFFRIDHPLDPQNKYLQHACVESSQMKNLYDGIVELDEEGAAWVELPEWFKELNRDFRYQLTAIGAAAPQLHVAAEVSEEESRFKIAGGEPGMKVCWQLTGIRNDRWAEANPLEVEQDKPEEDQGWYLHPQLYGELEERRIGWPIWEEQQRRMEEQQRRMEEQLRQMEELRRQMEEREEPPQPPAPPPGTDFDR